MKDFLGNFPPGGGYPSTPGPLSKPESRMSAKILIGKHKILNSKPESEEIINYLFIFHEILIHL